MWNQSAAPNMWNQSAAPNMWNRNPGPAAPNMWNRNPSAAAPNMWNRNPRAAAPNMWNRNPSAAAPNGGNRNQSAPGRGRQAQQYRRFGNNGGLPQNASDSDEEPVVSDRVLEADNYYKMVGAVATLGAVGIFPWILVAAMA
jgi:hypothetical protein